MPLKLTRSASTSGPASAFTSASPSTSNTTTAATSSRSSSPMAASNPRRTSSLRRDVAQSSITISSPLRPPPQLESESSQGSTNLQLLVSKMGNKIPRGRQSVFTEIGLDDATTNTARRLVASHSHHKRPSFIELDEDEEREEKEFGQFTELKRRSTVAERGTLHHKRDSDSMSSSFPPTPPLRLHKRQNSAPAESWYSRLTNSKGRPRVKSAAGAPSRSLPGFQRFALVAMLIAVIVPAFTYHSRYSTLPIMGAEAGVVRPRATSPTDVCQRWAHQAAEVNGTLYIYGGETKQERDQTEDTWSNYFLTLDLNKDWKTDSPALKGMEIPDGPPAVANGFLWKDYDNLFLYGGQFSDSPYRDPDPESIWQYNINGNKWTEFKNPKTSEGNYSEPGGQPVHRAAEGAGVSVPELGFSWYFGGHIDWATIPGWSRQTERVFLNSLLEFTHYPFYNSGIEKYREGGDPEEPGVFRNITSAGLQSDADDFPDRADGILVFVPGWGDSGVLIGLAGGAGTDYAENFDTLTVYDIANSNWFHQDTSGDTPKGRVNPCVTIASAPDGSSFQIYMFGGQNLRDNQAEQSQTNEMYILTIPSFTWIKVDSDDNTPDGRAGHTCTMRDGQIIVVGGYTGSETSCESPGIYVFDASELKWRDEFKAGDHKPDHHLDNSVLAGSYGYEVPKAVKEIVGGGDEGSATVTAPAAGPTGGPFATGTPPVFTVTETGPGSTATGDSSSDGDGDSDDDSGPDEAGLIAAGVIAGVFGVLALYLGFCAWLYRRQVAAYKRHLAVSNRFSGVSADALNDPALTGGTGGAAAAAAAAILPGFSKRGGSGPRHQPVKGRDSSEETFGWVGSERGDRQFLNVEPHWNSEETTPNSGSAAAHGEKKSGSTRRRGSTSGESTEGLLDGQEPSFFNVVMGPRRALRVVNGID